jgi:electron transfer flavoprotein alpha subunit
MNYAVILNGCSDTFLHQALEVNGFLSSNGVEEVGGSTIIIYCEDERKAELVANAPTVNVKLIKVARYQPENVLACIKQLESNVDTDLYLFPSDFAGKELCVRFAYRISGSSLAAVSKFEIDEEKLICYKAVYSNHMMGKFNLHKKPYCISIAKGSVDDKPIQEKQHHIISETNKTMMIEDNFIKRYEFTEEASECGLVQAKIILVAGRGAKKKENVERLEKISKELGAELGVSRPVAMSAWTSMNHLVGVSGVMAKPKLCITAGVSGAAALIAGIEKSEYIVAINTDERAPIIKASDVAIIDDYETVLEELLKIIKEAK